MASIIFKVVVIALLVAFLGFVVRDDRRTRKIREAEEKAAEAQRKRS